MDTDANYTASSLAVSDVGNPSPDQTSGSLKPENDRARRRIYLGLFLIIPLGLAAFNVNVLLDRNESAGWRWFSAGSLIVITAGFAYLVRRALQPFIGGFRLKRGRCVHCGYDFTAHHSVRCPECGRDPVNLDV